MNNKTPTISVIMPMYNAEKYVRLTIQSLLNQTFKDFEAIFIDDCSTDNTVKVAESFKDKRIKIIRNEKNFGNPGLVRNVGLDIAKGKYIYFLDNDDFMMPQALEILLTNIKKSNADVVTSYIYLQPVDGEFQSLNNLQVRNIPYGFGRPVNEDFKQRFIEEYCNSQMPILLWLSMFNRKFIEENKIRFKPFVGEDHFFWIEVLCATKNLIKINNPFYIYRVRTSSLSHSTEFNYRGLRMGLQAIKNIPEFCNDKLTEAMKKFNVSVDEFLINYTSMMFIHFVMQTYVAPFYKKESKQTMAIVKEELSSANDLNFFETIMHGFIYENVRADDMKMTNIQLRGQLMSKE